MDFIQYSVPGVILAFSYCDISYLLHGTLSVATLSERENKPARSSRRQEPMIWTPTFSAGKHVLPQIRSTTYIPSHPLQAFLL